MLKWLLSLIVVGFSTPSYATVYTDPDKVCALAREGNGAWFDNEGMWRCLELDVVFVDLQDERDNLDLQVQSLARELDRYKEVIEIRENTLVVMRDQNAIAHARIYELENEVDAWYRNPWIVGAIGIFVGGAAVGITVVAVSLN